MSASAYKKNNNKTTLLRNKTTRVSNEHPRTWKKLKEKQQTLRERYSPKNRQKRGFGSSKHKIQKS